MIRIGTNNSGDFYRTDVDVPADLIVDGKVYQSVGIRFRGSSFLFLRFRTRKKSFNIAVDYGDDRPTALRLQNAEPTERSLRPLLPSAKSSIRELLPTTSPPPKANFVKLVINGESWGIYVNSQQFNKDFLDEWFGTKGGVRWKVPTRTRERLSL